MKFGLKDTDYDFLDKLIFAPLREKGAKIYVFGSRATKKNHPFSDIDILVEPGSNKEEIRSLIPTLRDQIEESYFPIKVDIVLFEDLVQSYRDSVLRERIEV